MDLRTAFNQALHQANVRKADGSSGEEFQFTHEGMGNIPVEILNLKRYFQGQGRSLGNTYFERVSHVTTQLLTFIRVFKYHISKS